MKTENSTVNQAPRWALLYCVGWSEAKPYVHIMQIKPVQSQRPLLAEVNMHRNVLILKRPSF